MEEIIEWSQLPEEMIQHIQSFLSGKEAARTTILSKSWYNAWLTRTNLDFNENDIPEWEEDWDYFFNFFNTEPPESAFVNLVEETLQRYERLNLKIRRFKLLASYCISDEICCRGTELTKKAMKLGATDIDIRFFFKFVLPREVLQSESLVRLSMHFGIIHLQDLTCWRLKYLKLRQVRIQDNNNYNIWDIICRMCPLIEELVLSTLSCNISHSNHCFVLKPPGLIANDFHKLKVLSLKLIEIGEWLFPYLSCKFPCLKELTLKYCTGYEEIHICSDSLERVVLFEDYFSMTSRVEFDVPRIRRFECELYSFVPPLSFKTTSTKWESHISFSSRVHSSSWFVKFRKFLLELSSSKIYLHLKISRDDAYEYASCHMIIGLPKPPIVELLWLTSSVESALLEELFWSCRPKLIRLPLFCNKYEAVKLICNTLIKEDCAIHDLEEVNVEISKHIAWTWSRSNMRAASEFAYSGGWIDTDTHVCLQLKWGSQL